MLLSVVLFTVSQTMTLILVRSLNAMELAREEDQGARFVSSITLATKTATAWGIYSDMDAYTSGPEINLAPQGNVLVCDSPTQSGTSILYFFVYDPVSQTLKRFENNMNTERMTLKGVTPISGPIFNQNLGLRSRALANTCPEPTADVFSLRYSAPDEIKHKFRNGSYTQTGSGEWIRAGRLLGRGRRSRPPSSSFFCRSARRLNRPPESANIRTVERKRLRWAFWSCVVRSKSNFNAVRERTSVLCQPSPAKPAEALSAACMI